MRLATRSSSAKMLGTPLIFFVPSSTPSTSTAGRILSTPSASLPSMELFQPLLGIRSVAVLC